MLLNQCLAISLSPLSPKLTSQWEHQKEGCENSEEEEVDNIKSKQDQAKSVVSNQNQRETTTIEKSSKQWSKLNLFHQLIELNSRNLEKRSETNEYDEKGANADWLSGAQSNLSEALTRVEFAGFVVPHWLLLSGTYDDLLCIKSSWSEGIFKAPAGFKIETIGNIRSVSVDYFALGNEHSEVKLKHQEKQQQTRLSRLHNKRTSTTNSSHKSTCSSSSSQVSSSFLADPFPNHSLKFAPLDSAIFSSIVELTQSNCENFVHLKQLIDHLNLRYSQLIDLPAVEFIDCALNGLIKSGRLRVRSMSERQVEESVLSTRERSEIQFQKVPSTADNYYSHHNQEAANLSSKLNPIHSVFLDQLISLAPEWEAGERRKVKVPKSAAGEQQEGRRGRSSATNKSNSTTLDSGIQSCDLVSSSSANSPSAQEPSIRNINNNLLLDSPEQVVVGPCGEQLVVGVERKKRGFSLSRSFKPLMQQQHHEERKKRSQSKAEATDLELDENENFRKSRTRQSSRQSKLSRTNQSLSTLFRSKSMRIISSAKQQQETFKGAQEINCDHRPESNQNNNNNKSNTFNWMEPTNARFSQRQQHQEASIDYLASAQAHKRTFSTRKNSLLFNVASSNQSAESNELGGGSKFVLFLRKLFTIRSRSSSNQPTNEQQQQQQQHRFLSEERTLIEHSIDRQQTKIRADIQLEVSANSSSSSTSKVSQKQADLKSKKVSSSSSPTSSSSSGSSSLIEFLDCTPANSNSRRPLLRAQLEQPETLKGNAWRLSNTQLRTKRSRQKQAQNQSPVSTNKQSEVSERCASSMSQDSMASGSSAGAKSTVSQQLRQHLDEAYRRHRNCTSKREREFIDSINVLRQASRHALQSDSRSSSKNRQANKLSLKSGAASECDTSSSIGSSCARKSSPPAENDHFLKLKDEQKFLCHCNRTYGETNNNNNNQLSPDLDLMKEEEDDDDDESELRRLSGDFESETEPWSLEQVKAAEAPGERLKSVVDPLAISNCCVCSSYLGHSATRAAPPAAVCPLAAAAAAAAATACCSTVACCLPKMEPHTAPNLIKNSEDSLLHLEGTTTKLANDSTHNDFCCPLWRSMVYNYCQTAPTGFYPARVPSLLALERDQHQEQVNSAPFSDLGLERAGVQSFASPLGSHLQLQCQQPQQQQQHNTTIDLRIEIGADFKNQIKRTHKRRAPREKQVESLSSEAADEDETQDDSLDDADDDEEEQASSTLATATSTSSSSSSSSSSSASASKERRPRLLRQKEEEAREEQQKECENRKFEPDSCDSDKSHANITPDPIEATDSSSL